MISLFLTIGKRGGRRGRAKGEGTHGGGSGGRRLLRVMGNERQKSAILGSKKKDFVLRRVRHAGTSRRGVKKESHDTSPLPNGKAPSSILLAPATRSGQRGKGNVS